MKSTQHGDRSLRSPWLVIGWTLWFAILTSLGEMAYWTYTKEVTRYRILDWAFLWRIPIGYALIFGAIAIAFVLLRFRVTNPGRVLLSACFFVAACAWLPIAMKGLYYWAVLLLAAGIGLQAGRAGALHIVWLDRLVRRSLPGLSVAVLGLGGAFWFWPVYAEHRAIARLPPPLSKPNVLLIVLDTVRAKSLSGYGYHRQTSPHLDSFATRGTTFSRAFSTAPWTLPSHASLFTGRLPHELSASFSSPLDGRYPTLAETLSSAGYLTAGFVANNWFAGSAFGLARGFQRYEDEATSPMRALMNTSLGSQFLKATRIPENFPTHDNFGRKSAGHVNASFLTWLSAQTSGRPFFAFLNYVDAHGPYVPPDPFATAFSAARPNGKIGSKPLDQWSAAEVRELNDAYDSAIAYLDAQVGRLLEQLDKGGWLDNTVVVITSDHGEQFGEHGLLDHVTSLYPALLHVPLIVVHPGHVPAGVRAEGRVSLRDIPATVLDLVDLGRRQGFPGVSLFESSSPTGRRPRATAEEPIMAEVERVAANFPSWYPAKNGRLKSAVFRNWQYIVNYGTQVEELYDLGHDPDAVTDMAGANPKLVEEYRRRLWSLLSTREQATVKVQR